MTTMITPLHHPKPSHQLLMPLLAQRNLAPHLNPSQSPPRPRPKTTTAVAMRLPLHQAAVLSQSRETLLAQLSRTSVRNLAPHLNPSQSPPRPRPKTTTAVAMRLPLRRAVAHRLHPVRNLAPRTLVAPPSPTAAPQLLRAETDGCANRQHCKMYPFHSLHRSNSSNKL